MLSPGVGAGVHPSLPGDTGPRHSDSASRVPKACPATPAAGARSPVRVCLRLLADRRSHPTRPRRSQERQMKALETVAVSTCGWFLLLSFRELVTMFPLRSLTARWGQLEGAARVPGRWRVTVPDRPGPFLGCPLLATRGRARPLREQAQGCSWNSWALWPQKHLGNGGGGGGGAHTGRSACWAGEHRDRAAAGSDSSVSASAREGEAVGLPAEGGLAQRC